MTRSAIIASGLRKSFGDHVVLGGVDLDVYYAVHKAFDELTAAAIDKTVRITDGRGSDVSFTLGKPGFAKPRRASSSINPATSPITTYTPSMRASWPTTASTTARLTSGSPRTFRRAPVTSQ